MTGPDLDYIRGLAEGGALEGPVLELGGGYGGATSREIVVAARLEYAATDIQAGPGVEFVADFDGGTGLDALEAAGPYGSVLVLNVLEHPFNLLTVLDNAVRLTVHGGKVAVVAPAIRALHNFPIDCCRLLADWYRQFGQTRKLVLNEESFWYVGTGAICGFMAKDGQEAFPAPVAAQTRMGDLLERGSLAFQRLRERNGQSLVRRNWHRFHPTMGPGKVCSVRSLNAGGTRHGRGGGLVSTRVRRNTN